MSSTPEDSSAHTDTIQQEEFHRRPVPMSDRLGFSDPAWVWSGFGLAFFSVIVGAIIQQGLGTTQAILAIILGNFILFIYSGAIGYGNGRWGLNFPLTLQAVFGVKGAVLPVTVVSLLVTGWYSFNTWLTADVLAVLFGVRTAVVVGVLVLILGLIYAAPVIFGLRSMANVRKIAIPAMAVFVVYYFIMRVIPEGSALFEGSGTGDIGFWTGVGMAWAIFAVSGTMTGDIVRYTRNGRQAVGVTAVAFLFSNAPFMIAGALMGGAAGDPALVYFFEDDVLIILVPLAAIAFLSNWCTADACLYNASLGFTNIVSTLHFRQAAVAGTVIGLVAGASGWVGDVVSWLALIGLVVPSIGGIIIADYFFTRGNERGYGVRRQSDWNVAAIIAVIVGIIAAAIVNEMYPDFLFGAAGIVTSMLMYVVLDKLFGPALGTTLSSDRTDAEAEA